MLVLSCLYTQIQKMLLAQNFGNVNPQPDSVFFKKNDKRSLGELHYILIDFAKKLISKLKHILQQVIQI